MVIRLGDRGAMTREALLAFLVRFKNRAVRFRLLLGHPRQQRRTEVEADVRVVIRDLFNVLIAVQNS